MKIYIVIEALLYIAVRRRKTIKFWRLYCFILCDMQKIKLLKDNYVSLHTKKLKNLTGNWIVN